MNHARLKIAIDLDGTISQRPLFFFELAGLFSGSGHTVIVLTAAAGELPAAERPAEVAKRLMKHGFRAPHELVCIESREKGEWCNLNNVNLLFDDDPKVVADVEVKSPRTVCVLVK